MFAPPPFSPAPSISAPRSSHHAISLCVARAWILPGRGVGKPPPGMLKSVRARLKCDKLGQVCYGYVTS